MDSLFRSAVLTTLIAAHGHSFAGDPAAERAATDALIASCTPCHGATGASLSQGVPHLDRQNADYLVESIELLRAGTRPSQVPEHIPAAWSAKEIAAVARHFSRSSPTREVEATESELVKRGRDVFLEKCETCHEDGGRETDYRGTGSPRLAGQRIAYLAAQIRAYVSGQRPFLVDVKRQAFMGQPLTIGAHRVRGNLDKVSDADADAIAHFLASNTPREAPKRNPRHRR